jgi:hypothetical protein
MSIARRKVLVPMAFCVISQLPIFDFQRNWLIKVYESFIFPPELLRHSTKLQEKKWSLEFYISLLFHHLYYNSEWKNEVLISYNNHRLSSYRNCRTTGLTLPNFTFHTLMTTMKPNRILELIQYLLLEKKILLVQSQYSNNAIITESLLSLLYPL